MTDRDIILAAIQEQIRRDKQEADDAKAKKPNKRFG